MNPNPYQSPADLSEATMPPGRWLMYVVIFAYFVVGVVISPLFFVLVLMVAMGKAAEWLGDQIVKVVDRELMKCWADWGDK